MDIRGRLMELGKEAREAAGRLLTLPTAVKNRALLAMAEALEAETPRLLEANQEDVAGARAAGRPSAFVDRLTLTPARIQDMARGLREVAALPDPVGEVIRMWRAPNGMQVGRMRVPIGVIGIIYESRPNVTAEASALCLKSGNAVFLRGGSEAFRSNQAIVQVLRQAGEKEGIPPGAITFVDIPDRQAVDEMLRLDAYIDLMIPRGGPALIQRVTQGATMPVIKHDRGLCHLYVDEFADLEMAARIAFNAKVQRPGTCNAIETLLVHEAVASRFVPEMIRQFREAGVEIRGCPRTRTLAEGVQEAREEDWDTEYLDLILNVRVVEGMEAALAHIARHGSRHTEAIVTQDYQRALRFLREVDAASVMVNASPRLHDGGQFGMGAEMGISTTRIHARGPMGLEELTTFKFIVFGEGHLRQ